MTEPTRPWVIVLLNLDGCPVYDNTRCVMEAHGPYTEAEADAAFDTFPPGFAPHIVLLNP